VAGIRKKLLDDDMPQWAKRAGELLDAFTLKHEAISDLMGQDNIGLRLQNLDSDIAERVFLEMAAKDVCTLGWHDFDRDAVFERVVFSRQPAHRVRHFSGFVFAGIIGRFSGCWCGGRLLRPWALSG